MLLFVRSPATDDCPTFHLSGSLCRASCPLSQQHLPLQHPQLTHSWTTVLNSMSLGLRPKHSTGKPQLSSSCDTRPGFQRAWSSVPCSATLATYPSSLASARMALPLLHTFYSNLTSTWVPLRQLLRGHGQLLPGSLNFALLKSRVATLLFVTTPKKLNQTILWSLWPGPSLLPWVHYSQPPMAEHHS